MNGKVLFVDDEPNALHALARMLRNQRDQWEIHFAAGVDQALGQLQSDDFDVVVSDVSMPGRDGFSLLSHIREVERTRDLPFLMLTGINQSDIKRKALDLGATDLLNKPANREDLVARINNMLRMKSYQDKIKSQNAQLDRKVRVRTAELEASRVELIWRLGKAAEYRDSDTGNHVVRVGFYCKVLADGLGLDRAYCERIFLTSPLHDVGKIGIPDRILLKRGKLLPDEWAVMKQHCAIGADILRQNAVNVAPVARVAELFGKPVAKESENPMLKMAEEIALAHHERWDGKGYPKGLAGKQIPLSARIVAVADVCDALFSKRPYKPGYGEKKVLEIMRDGNGRHFDPQVYACFEKRFDLVRDVRVQFADRTGEAAE